MECVASRTLCNWKAALNMQGKKGKKKEKYICHSPHCASKQSRCVQKGLNVPSVSLQTLKMNKGAETAMLYMFKSELHLAVLPACIAAQWRCKKIKQAHKSVTKATVRATSVGQALI